MYNFIMTVFGFCGVAMEIIAGIVLDNTAFIMFGVMMGITFIFGDIAKAIRQHKRKNEYVYVVNCTGMETKKVNSYRKHRRQHHH